MNSHEACILSCCYFQQEQFLYSNQFYPNITKRTHLPKSTKLVFISAIKIVIKIIFHLHVYSFINSFCLNILVSIISFHKKWRFNRNDCNDIQHEPSNLSQCSIKYSALLFVPINFEMTILSTLTSQIFVFVL